MKKPTSVNVIFTGSVAREIFGEESIVVLLKENEATLQGLINKLDRKQRGKVSEALLKPSISILLNGQDIEFLADKETRLREGDRVAIIPLVAGG